jgi:hypothetical protein
MKPPIKHLERLEASMRGTKLRGSVDSIGSSAAQAASPRAGGGAGAVRVPAENAPGRSPVLRPLRRPPR